MKIICTDNFNRESKSDQLILENVNEYYGNIICDFLNSKFSGEYSPDYFKLEDNNYRLYRFVP